MSKTWALSSSFFREPTTEKWAAAKAAGLPETELVLRRAPSTMEILAAGEALHAILAEGGMTVSSAHLPFGRDYDISSTDPQIRQKTIDGHLELIPWLSGKGIGIAVLHPSSEPIEPDDRQARFDNSIAAIERIAGFACGHNVRVAVENLPRTCLGNCAAEILALTRSGQTAGICFDSNHLLIESQEDFLSQVAPYVITTHFSDYDRIDERHWLPGEGVVDWKQAVRLLAEAGYAGRFLFEVREDCLPSSDRKITPRELVERFRSLI